MVGAWSVNWYINGRVVLRGNAALGKPPFQFFAANVRQHLAIDFDARRKLLAALLYHLHPLVRVIPDVPVLEREIILTQNGTDTLAPTAMRLEISDDFRIFHARSLQRRYKRRNHAIYCR